MRSTGDKSFKLFTIKIEKQLIKKLFYEKKIENNYEVTKQ